MFAVCTVSLQKEVTVLFLSWQKPHCEFSNVFAVYTISLHNTKSKICTFGYDGGENQFTAADKIHNVIFEAVCIVYDFNIIDKIVIL